MKVSHWWSIYRQQKRGYYSLLILGFLVASSLVLELWVNKTPYVVSYQQKLYFPLISDPLPGTTFGLDYEYETNYRELSEVFAADPDSKNWLILPPIPFTPYESDLNSYTNTTPPHPPDWEKGHFLGTDTSGRDVLARLLYAFRVSVFFSFFLYLTTTSIGVIAGCLMGYLGGVFDLVFQRLVEIWSTLPTLYIIIILTALSTPSIPLLLVIFTLAGWTQMTWLMRSEVYREKNRQYCEAARAMGAGHTRIVFLHLLPNALTPIIAALPFQMVAGIGMLTSLDYLGYGLPVPTPSWGEMLRQGQSTFTFAPWILLAPSGATLLVLMLFSFVGEAVRACLDPKRIVLYS